MAAFKISAYQVVNYFMSGFIVVFSTFMFYWPHPNGVMTDLDKYSIGAGLVFVLLCCFTGILINSFRNTFIEFLILNPLTEKSRFKKWEIEWNYFHTA